jgi:hypothetical protein
MGAGKGDHAFCKKCFCFFKQTATCPVCESPIEPNYQNIDFERAVFCHFCFLESDRVYSLVGANEMTEIYVHALATLWLQLTLGKITLEKFEQATNDIAQPVREYYGNPRL